MFLINKIKSLLNSYFRPNEKDPTEFLPGGLAVRETPPHPAPRIFLYVVFAIIVFVLLWAILGKTEVVAVANGTIIPSDKSKIIQVFDRATVEKIYVRDGDKVKKGDTLIDLDRGLLKADLERAESEMSYNRAQALRVEALISAIEQEKEPIFEPGPDIPEVTAQKARQRLMGDYRNLQSKLQENRARIKVSEQEIKSFRNAIGQRRRLMKVKSQRLENYKTLAAENYLPQNRYLEIQEEVLTLQTEIRNLSDRVAEKNAQIVGLKSEADVLIAQTKLSAAEEAQEARRNIQSLIEQVKKAEINLKTTRLKAPVAGTVQQLSVNTVGGVVTPAQPVLVIVPEDAPLEAEVTYLNKDIGFIETGQDVHIKIASFPYTKYGMIDGTVSVVSGDAIEDEKLGFVYKGRVKIHQSTIRVGKKDVPLVPGMQVTAEIKTDERRLIEYFLSPIMVHTDQAFRER
ncbi:MAG: HlyD family type I secretion periplasmic adaptor subunit [Pseudomonadota bacterium]